MRSPNRTSGLLTALTVWLNVSMAGMAAAQEGPGLSSGSGAGTGSGYSSGVQRSQSGSISGNAPPGISPGAFEGIIPPRQVRPEMAIPRGPGVGVTFPNDPGILPFLVIDESGEGTGIRGPSRVTSEILQNAQKIDEPGNKSRALQEVARAAILSGQLIMAHRALEDAASSSLEEKNSLIHDQLIIGVITITHLLTEAILSEGRERSSILQPEADVRAEPMPKRPIDAKLAVRLVRLEWQRALYAAGHIKNPTYRSEYQERVLESMASGSGRIASNYTKSDDRTAEGEKKSATDEIEQFRRTADEILVEAERATSTIERPIWKNNALVRIAVTAGDSQQYSRAVAIARGIDNVEARAQGLILVAESQCRHNQADAATQTYQDVAEAVAVIPQTGLRAVLVGFLVDSLISTGRFDDARFCTAIYPAEEERFVALGAIAESQGTRGAAPAARRWIDRDAPPSYRDALHRRVNSGVLKAMMDSRSKDSGRDSR